jgi:hypothetical protein
MSGIELYDGELARWEAYGLSDVHVTEVAGVIEARATTLYEIFKLAGRNISLDECRETMMAQTMLEGCEAQPASPRLWIPQRITARSK